MNKRKKKIFLFFCPTLASVFCCLRQTLSFNLLPKTIWDETEKETFPFEYFPGSIDEKDVARLKHKGKDGLSVEREFRCLNDERGTVSTPRTTSDEPIVYFPIPHNALCLPPPNFAQTIVAECSWIAPRVFHKNSLKKIWGANRVHYGQLENSELVTVKQAALRDYCVSLRPCLSVFNIFQ